MNTVKIDRKSALIIAHRGLSGLEAENTASAFVAAGNRSYYGIETDIHRTGDGRIIINHDADLKRIAGENIPVEEVSFDVIQSVVHFDKDGTRDRIDLRSPSLSDYLKICQKYEKHSVIELKSGFTDEEIANIIEIIKAGYDLKNITFISFKYENLLKIRKILPTQSVQFLFCEITDEIVENVIRDKIDVDVMHTVLSRENIKRFHDAGLKVNCWTVDNKERAEELIEFGVDYITTNILE
jgi:glycerophosphoryl diester phosphodiesterase